MRPTLQLIRKLHKRLVKRHLATGDPNLLGVGLGWALKRGRPDPSRGLSVIYAVRRKKKRLPLRQRIPKEVHAFMRRKRQGRRRQYRIILPTDVIECRRAVETGIKLDGGNGPFTTGVLISWEQQAERSWGLVTVGHGAALHQVVIHLRGQASFTREVYAQTDEYSSLDAALIKLTQEDIATRLARFIPAPGTPPPVSRTLLQLINDGQTSHPTGLSLTASGSEPFTLFAYFPFQITERPIIPLAPNRLHLLLALGKQQAFARGSSGSVWIANSGLIDAIQIAGFPDDFTRGIGQPISDYLGWASKQVGARVTLVAAF